jgi:ribosomal protein L22
MADRKTGKSSPPPTAADAETKQDQPSAEAGKAAGKGAKAAKETTAKAKAEEKAEATEQKPPKKATSSRKPRTPKAEATAAEETGVGKEEAEAAEKSPEGQKRTPAAKTRARDKAESKPKAKKTEDGAPRERVTVRAHAKYVRTSARKARLVCDHIRGKSVEEAFAILAHTPRHVAEDWRKLLQSAVANAEHNHELIGDDLRIASVTADEGPTLKRFRPRAMGRATRIRKRTSHLTITLTPKD